MLFPFAITWSTTKVVGISIGAAIFIWAVYAACKRWKFVYLGTSGEFLCDSCKYNDERYCSVPERPNARKCKDYKSVL